MHELWLGENFEFISDAGEITSLSLLMKFPVQAVAATNNEKTVNTIRILAIRPPRLPMAAIALRAMLTTVLSCGGLIL